MNKSNLVAHLVPDIIFRTPVPIVVIAILTILTTKIRRQSAALYAQTRYRRKVSWMLTVSIL